MMCEVVEVERGIVGVPEDEAELDTTAPVLGHGIGLEAMFEINGALVDVVTEREEENAPIDIREP